VVIVRPLCTYGRALSHGGSRRTRSRSLRNVSRRAVRRSGRFPPDERGAPSRAACVSSRARDRKQSVRCGGKTKCARTPLTVYNIIPHEAAADNPIVPAKLISPAAVVVAAAAAAVSVACARRRCPTAARTYCVPAEGTARGRGRYLLFTRIIIIIIIMNNTRARREEDRPPSFRTE